MLEATSCFGESQVYSFYRVEEMQKEIPIWLAPIGMGEEANHMEAKDEMFENFIVLNE